MIKRHKKVSLFIAFTRKKVQKVSLVEMQGIYYLESSISSQDEDFCSFLQRFQTRYQVKDIRDLVRQWKPGLPCRGTLFIELKRRFFRVCAQCLKTEQKISFWRAKQATLTSFQKPWQILFCPSKILLNPAILQYKKNRQEFIRIFKKRKSIGKGFKINVGL